MKFYVEWPQSHVRGPLGARVMTIFVKTYICVKVEVGGVKRALTTISNGVLKVQYGSLVAHGIRIV